MIKHYGLLQGATIHGSFLGFDLMAKDKGGNGGVIINTSSLAGNKSIHHI